MNVILSLVADRDDDNVMDGEQFGRHDKHNGSTRPFDIGSIKMKKLMTIILAVMAISSIAAAQTAQVQVIHNSPDPAAASVDIYVNAGMDPAIPDFGFREATPTLELPAGVELVLGIAPGSSAGPDDVIANFPVTLEDGGSYTVMATGVLDGGLPGNPEGEDTAFTLKIFSPLMSSAPAGTTNLLVYHGSPNAPTVDVQVRDGGILVDDLTYGMFTMDYLNAPAVDLVLEITPGMDNETVVAAYDAPLSALDGAGATVFASGFLGEAGLPAFGLFVALGDGTVIELHEASVATESVSLSGVKKLFQ